jgi:putative nucleotidyltransferase with HDIG domain
VALPPLNDIPDLPTLPSVAAQAMAVAEDPSASASDLLRVLMSDPPLAAKVLKVANSVHFHRGRDVTDLQTAIVRLGFANVRNLLMSVSVVRSFNGWFVGAPYSREDFWTHSIAAGALALRLASGGERLSASTAFITGLLHDVGKLVLDRYARDGFLHAIRLAQGAGIPLREAERKRFGRDHAEIGGELLAAWRFPRELREPIRWHHDPAGCEAAHRPHAVLLQAADWLASSRRLGYGGNEHPERPSDASLRSLGLDDARAGELVRDVEKDPLLQSLLPA